MNIDKQLARKIYKSEITTKKRMEIAVKKDVEKRKLRQQIEEDIAKRMKQRLVENLEYQNVLTQQEEQDQKLSRRIATLEIEKKVQEKQQQKGSFYAGKTLRSQIISSIDDKIKRLKL